MCVIMPTARAEVSTPGCVTDDQVRTKLCQGVALTDGAMCSFPSSISYSPASQRPFWRTHA